MRNQIESSRPPASSSSTRFDGSAESRLASRQPAAPAPTTMKSKSLMRAERRAAPKPARIPSGDRSAYPPDEGSSSLLLDAGGLHEPAPRVIGGFYVGRQLLGRG